MASDGEISCTNDPNFAVIYSFLKVFGKLYGLEIPSIAKLQQLLEDTDEVSEPLKELHLRLLRRALKSVQSGRWERCLVKFCHQHGHHQEAWEIERFSYKKASTEVKLKTLKILLEYQFTCHAKFKAAVNALSCKDLRLDPLGRDKNGCVYWLQVDDEANLSLYKEDQDEETWQLIARNREELVKVIGQLKNGEEICPSTLLNTNEDSSGTEIATTTEKSNTQAEDENEEFLSPESESDHDDEETKADKKPNILLSESLKQDKTNIDEEIKTEEGHTLKESENVVNATIIEEKIETVDQSNPFEKTSENYVNSEHLQSNELAITEEGVDNIKEEIVKEEKEKKVETEEFELTEKTENKESVDLSKEINSDEISEAIEEPIMIVTGEGSGADCESFYLGEEISEPVMYIYGEGCGYDNDTGNPEVLEETNNERKESDEENGTEDCVNGEHSINDISNTTIGKMAKSVKLKGDLPTVTKRLLKKQSNDSSEVLKSDSKKHCVRKPSRSNSLRSTSSSNENDLKREGSANDKTTDSESAKKKIDKKGRGKMRRRPDLARKIKLNDTKESSPVSDEDCQNSKASIIEKRKNSVSSDLDTIENTENEKEGSPDKETKVENDLPSKKIRLESTAKKIEVSHSKETDTTDNIGKEEAKSENNENNDNLNTEHEDKDPIAMRKKIKANKGKFKRKKVLQNKVENSKLDNGTNVVEEKEKNKSKPLKRSLIDATNSDKNKSESQSESEDDMPITSGKRLKIKPKKIITSSRKKVEAKLLQKKSSDDSEEETLHSIAGKKTGKKVLKKKTKGKEKPGSQLEESDLTPVRQSRRIAQQKIKEEADRRHLEEVALRELKMIHKKKSKDDDEEEWRASGSSSESPVRAPRRAAWRAADSTAGSESDSDDLSDRPQEPDLVFDKSDHEFSPESDLESGEPSEPLKRARTLQEGTDDGFCKRCGSGEQPEWILLCDKCDEGYHASCLKPMLFLVPEGDWFCPSCNHEMLISSLESELVKYDELLVTVEEDRAKRKELERQQEKPPPKENSEQKEDEGSGSCSSSSEDSSGSSEGAVYRLRARRQLPVSYRAQEYDRLISSAIKEEYIEPTTSAGNQGRGKDISTIIEAAEEEKLKAEREEAIAQGKPIEIRKKKKQRRKPRKLNSLEVVSEDDDETDEDFKDTGMESSSEEISSSAERDSTDSRSSDSLPIRRPCRTEKKDRPKLRESSPEEKKKKGEFAGSTSESSGAKEWPHKVKTKSKSRSKRDKSYIKKSRKKRGLTQYDAAGNVIRARVTYGGLSDDSPNDWSPKHRTRQKKINYTEMPNTESEDEMHKGSGKHMPDSSDEFKVDDSDVTSDSDAERAKRARADDVEHQQRALSDLIKTAVVPLEKLPDDVTKAKEEELQAHLNAQAALSARGRGRGRGGRGSRGARSGRGARAGSAPDDALSKLVGVKIKDLGQEPMKPNQLEREKKRQEREAKLAEKEAKRVERIQKKEEKDKLKEQKAKEREEKRLARLAMQESKRMKKEKPEYPMSAPGAYGARPSGPAYTEYPEHRLPTTPRLQVRAELRGVPVAGPLAADQSLREGTLSVAGSPQPFKPASEEPSVITRMPHMLNHYRGPMMYSGGGPAGYGPRQGMMYVPHPGLPARPQYPPYYGLRALPPYPRDAPPPRLHPPGSSHGLPLAQHGQPGSSHGPPGPLLGPPGSSHGPPGSPHGPLGPSHGPPGPLRGPQGPLHGLPGSSHGPPGPSHGPPVSSHGPSGPMHGPPGPSQGPPGSSHGPPGPLHRPPGSPHGPPGSSHGLPGSSHGPPVSSHGPPGSSHGPPGSSHGPPGSLHGPPGSSHGPPRSMHGPPGTSHGPPVSLHGPPGSSHGPPGSSHGPPGSSHGPPGSSHGPPGSSHGPPGSSHGTPGSAHGPQGSMHGPPGSLHGQPGPLHGPPGSSHGLPGTMHGLPGSMHGPPRSSHGPPGASHGLPGPHGPGSLHGLLRAGPPVQLHGLRGPIRPSGSPAAPPPAPGPDMRAATTPPVSMPGAPHKDAPIKIKTEVKTEPEYHSPVQSPLRSSPEPPRHPKIKHTDNKERRPRYPLGPYAPQYGPYGPYAPPAPSGPEVPPGLLGMHARPPGAGPSPLQRMHLNLQQFLPPADKPEPARSPLRPDAPHYLPAQQHLRPHFGPPAARARASPGAAPHYGPPYEPPEAAPREPERTPPPAPSDAPAPPQGPAPSEPAPEPELPAALAVVKTEPRAGEEGGVFGGLVSYFSSQHEDELDA